MILNIKRMCELFDEFFPIQEGCETSVEVDFSSRNPVFAFSVKCMANGLVYGKQIMISTVELDGVFDVDSALSRQFELMKGEVSNAITKAD